MNRNIKLCPKCLKRNTTTKTPYCTICWNASVTAYRKAKQTKCKSCGSTKVEKVLDKNVYNTEFEKLISKDRG